MKFAEVNQQENRSQILDSAAIQHKIKRIAYQIWEDNHDQSEIVLIGIKRRGFAFAEAIRNYLQEISPLKVEIIHLLIEKRNPISEQIELQSTSDLTGKVIIICDDVANTGRTVFYAFEPILKFLPSKVRVAVLVDRRHKRYPVTPDYVGLSLSTTMQEHISVEFDDQVVNAYLS